MAGTKDPILSWLRDLISNRGMNTAALAKKTEIDRGRLRRLLSGSEPMLVDELMKISNALELSPADMGLPQMEGVDDPIAVSEPAPVRAADPYGNHARQLFEVAFALGTTFYFAAAIDELADSGVPEHVLKQHEGRPELVISLDAAHHRNNDPRIGEEGITLTLSFDQLYDCTFPWSSVRRVVFDVEWVDEDAPDSDPDDDEPNPSGNGPHLRLVT